MKFINYLTSITGVGIFPMISLLVFFVFFIALGIYTVKADKERLKYLASLPVEEKNENPTSSKND
jgi:hypothetical protein